MPRAISPEQSSISFEEASREQATQSQPKEKKYLSAGEKRDIETASFVAEQIINPALHLNRVLSDSEVEEKRNFWQGEAKKMLGQENLPVKARKILVDVVVLYAPQEDRKR